MNQSGEPEKGTVSGKSVSHGLLDYFRALHAGERKRLLQYVGFLALLLVLFGKWLVGLAVHAVGTDLHSHVLLVPLITLYLLSIQSRELPRNFATSPGLAVLLAVGGGLLLLLGWKLSEVSGVSRNDGLAVMAAAFLSFVIAGGFFFLGATWMKAAAFPMAFLIFIIPLPDAVVDSLETASKLASAEAAAMFFSLSGTPVMRDGQIFSLPNIVIEVAQECSGIRSSWVLFITSLVASHLFLNSPWRRALLVFLVIPLGILRNGFRILVIGLLCVNIGPHMIHHFIHKKGGPVFFVLSLIPLFLILWLLHRGERKRVACVTPEPQS